MGGSASASNEKNTQRFEFINHNVGDILNYYEFFSHIGIGRSATVYKALDIKTRLPRAIKEYRKSKMNSEPANKFEDEVKILKKLDHPNIMKIYEVIESSYSYYLACELLDGKNLMEIVLDDYAELEKPIIAKWMQDILYAISYCHHENIAHNDIRPENLVFENSKKDAKLKLIDFGISSEVAESKGNYGQVHFRAPETFEKESEIKDKELRLKSDIWSAGVVFYILLTKKSLFKGKDKNVEQDIKNFSPSSLEENIPDPEALDLLKAMLNPDQSSRIPAKEALNHPYIKTTSNLDAGLQESFEDILKKMLSFKIKSAFDKKMMSLVAIHILSADVDDENIKSKIFKIIDSKYDGYIDVEELEDALQYFKVKPEDLVEIKERNPDENFDEFTKEQVLIDEVMKNCDLDGNKTLSYTEFLTTSLDWKKYLEDEEKIETILKYFDIVHKEFLTQDELRSIIKLNKTDEKDDMNIFLKSYKDSNGMISKSNLKRYFLDISQNFL